MIINLEKTLLQTHYNELDILMSLKTRCINKDQ